MSPRPIKDDGIDFIKEALAYYNHVQGRLDRFESLGGHRLEITPEKISDMYDPVPHIIWQPVLEFFFLVQIVLRLAANEPLCYP